jgi:methenyltetrahydromethanopterin cyclohydrolase
MVVLSVNRKAHRLVERLIDDPEGHGVSVKVMVNGATIIDAGVEVIGSLSAGRVATEICMGGLGEATIGVGSYGDVGLPTITVRTDHPVIALLACQLAGWKIQGADGTYGYGSGPARALAEKPRKLLSNLLFEQLQYRDESDVAVAFLEPIGRRLPGEAEAAFIAANCNTKPGNVFMLAASASSLTGAVQISGRVAEMGLFKLAQLGHDPLRVKSAIGTAPIAGGQPDEDRAMGMCNDCIILAGTTYYVTRSGEGEEVGELVRDAPSGSSRNYGKPFYYTFVEAGRDFHKIDPALFSPASITLNDLRTGRIARGGNIDSELLKRSLGIS